MWILKSTTFSFNLFHLHFFSLSCKLVCKDYKSVMHIYAFVLVWECYNEVAMAVHQLDFG